MQLLHSLILGKGEPLLILHGLFGMGDNWKTLANKFAADFEVHLIDQRNHGRSFHTPEFSYELMADDLLRYMNHHGIEKAHLLGHSMGGKTVMLFATIHPERVKKLIVADIAPKKYPIHHDFIIGGLKNIDLDKMHSRKEIDAALSPHITEPAIRQFLMKNIYRIEKDRFALRFNLKSISENIHEVGKALPETARFDGATLFLKGSNSSYITERDTELIRKHFPDTEIEIIENAGHWLHAENPQDFYTKVYRFLKK